jgi:hypothetical protein
VTDARARTSLFDVNRFRRRMFVVSAVAVLTAGCETTVNLGDPEGGADAGGTSDAGAASADGSTSTDGSPPSGDSGGGALDAGDAGDAGPKGFFVYRSTYTADLGGLDGADFRCQSSAMGAGLSGKWKAWASDSAHDAADRILSNGPWFAVKTGIKLFNDHANLRGFPLAQLATDELGQPASDRWWTGTLANGVKSTNTCVGFSVMAMLTSGTTGTRVLGMSIPGKEWTEDVDYSCQSALALLCLEDE